VEFNDEVTFCKIIDGIIKFESRGIIISIDCEGFVVRAISFSFRSKIVNEIDLERFVFEFNFELPNGASNSIIDRIETIELLLFKNPFSNDKNICDVLIMKF
jgi:hypothetical protein